MYELITWNDEHQIPQNTTEFLLFITMVTAWEQAQQRDDSTRESESPPLTVQCMYVHQVCNTSKVTSINFQVHISLWV